MNEKIFNLFLIVVGNRISEVGVFIHEFDGSDDEKIKFLQNRTHIDWPESKRYQIEPITHSEYQSKCRLGTHATIFESIFLNLNTDTIPLFVITPIVDGRPRFDINSDMSALNLDEYQNSEHFPGDMVDYLQKYTSKDGFDFAGLINDDFLVSIKLLWNQQKYVSTAKLLLSMIDSIAFIEFGDVSKNFQKWLDRYSDLSELEISAEELWQFRNSLLHMTNLHSKAVLKGKAPSLVMYIGDAQGLVPPNSEATKYFNLKGLIYAINQALNKWLFSYVESPEKFEKFVERYDLTISDARMASFVHEMKRD